ncbi:trigger factor [bacterium]|nr:trigger factor [bacterium]
MHAHSHDVEVKKVDRVSPTLVRLTISFSGETLQAHEKSTAQQYAKDAALPGFRPGKAPVKMVLERYRDRIRQDVVSHLLEAGLSEAIEKTQLSPVSRPKILEIGKLGFDDKTPLEFKAEFEVEPEFSLKSYKGVPLKAAKDEVADKDVEESLNDLRERLGVLEPSDETKPKAGSFAVVEVGYALVNDPKKAEPPSSFTVELGKDKLIPEIDKALLAMSVGEQKEVEATFPADYHEKTLAGQKAKFDCKILELKKRTLPEANDAFAEQVRPGMTLLALKADIRKNLESSKKRETRRAQRQQILDHLVEKNSFEVPQSMIEMQSRKLIESMTHDLKSRGQELPTLKDEELKSVRKSAEEIVRGGLLLKKVAQTEKIELAEGKVQERVSELAQQWKQTPEQTQQFLESQGVMDRIRDEVLTDQIFDFLIQNAKA